MSLRPWTNWHGRSTACKGGLLLLGAALLLPAADKADFARDVQPILHARCGGCHGGEKPQGGFSVFTREALLKGGAHGPGVVPGASSKSLLIARVTASGPSRMPLGQPPLSEREVATLRLWIDAGAEWNANGQPLQGAASIAPRQTAVPPGFAHPLDGFLARYSKAKRVPLPALVSDAVFARRAYLDLTGLPPTPEEQAAFVAGRDPNKRGQLVDQLLANRRRYAEHWISFWNDLLRNEDGVAYPGETRAWITDWLLQALESNLPYDRMVRALLNPDKDGPRGFLAGINWGGDVSASQSVPMQAAQNSAQIFLGANLKCASCHDSFVSRWKLAQAFNLAAFFSDKPLEIARCEMKTGGTATPAFLFPELEQEAPHLSGRARAAELFTSPKNGRFARTLVNRYWRVLLGRGLVEPVDELDNPAWDADLLDWLASDFAAHGYDLHHLLRRIITSRAYQAVAVDEKESKDFVFRGPLSRRLTAEQYLDAVGAITGEWKLYDRQNGQPGTYERQWRFRSDRFTRALGRPDRSQVITTRSEEATTLQALEFVNGEVFAAHLRRAAQRLLADPPPVPGSIFDSGLVRVSPVNVDVDITGARRLWLVMEDLGSYDPPKVVAGWMKAMLTGPQGTTRLIDLPVPAGASVRRLETKTEVQEAVTATPFFVGSYDIEGRGFTRFGATVAVDAVSQRSETTGKVRFLLFTEEPDRSRLLRVAEGSPAARPPRLMGDALVTRLFRHALCRDPQLGERRTAAGLVAQGADGLEDLLWILFLSPEFQLIR
ncbi:MAG: DUF1549 domain-containing protein [Bryobacterales bacterium]|nr:DUF1549 domain-containing protein [Bryobacterales bacterium]